MKKFLLTLVGLLAITTASADIVENFATATWLPTADTDAAKEYTSTTTGIVYTMSHCKKGAYSGSSYLQVSGKNYSGEAYIEFALPEGTKSIKFHTGANASTNVTATITVGSTKIAENLKFATRNADFTANVPADLQNSKETCKVLVSNKYNAQFSSITYVTDGETPVGPEPVENTKVDIAAFLASADANVTYEFTKPVTAIYQNGSSLYVTDGTGYMLIFGTLTNKYNNGDIIPAGFTGKYKDFNGLPELENVASLQAGTPGTPVEPTVTTVEDANAEGLNAYIELEGVNVTGMAATGNFTITDPVANATIVGRNNFGIEAVNGENLTMRGFVAIFNGTYQIYPIEITTASGKEVVSAPTFSPAAGEVVAGTEVAIACATEGASIYYTLDDSEPTTSSALYSTPIVIDQETTIKALAVKEGMENSAVATATYTIKVPADATFNFTAPETLTPAYPANKDDESLEADGTAGNKQAIVSDITFTKGNVAVTSTKGTSTDAKIYYQSGGAIQLRVYNGGSTTVKSLDPGNNITKIVITYNNGSSSYNKVTAPSVGTWDKTTGTWTGNAQEVTFAYTGTQQINAIDVYCAQGLTGVDDVVADDANAPVEYYNLQGVRVENPENGLYIKRQGSTVTKVIIR